MSDPVERSWKVTRRTLGVSALALLGLAAAETWPAWRFWPSGEGLSDLATRPDAAALRALGARLGPPPADLEARLSERLKVGYDAAVAEDRRNGALAPVDGWLVAETELLAAQWLARDS